MDEIKKKEELEQEAPAPAVEEKEGVQQAAEPQPEPAVEEQKPTEPVADTPAAEEPAPEQAPEQPAQEEPEQPQVRTFTQEQVNALVGKARAEGREKGYEQAKREVLERYGVDKDDDLDGIFANGSRYEELSSRFEDERGSLIEARTELALVKSGILPERQGDVKAILGAQGLDITTENIESLLPTHPEWKAAPNPQPQPITQNPIPQPQEEGEPKGDSQLGAAPNPKSVELESEAKEAAEKEQAMKAFGIR